MIVLIGGSLQTMQYIRAGLVRQMLLSQDLDLNAYLPLVDQDAKQDRTQRIPA